MNWFQKFKKGLFTKTQILVGVTLTMITTSALVYAYQILALNVFTSGTSISSAQVNNNFQQINEMLSTMGKRFEVGIVSDQFHTYNSYSMYTTLSDLDFNTLFTDNFLNTSGQDLVSNKKFTVQEQGYYQFLMHSKTITGGGYGYMYFYKNDTGTANMVTQFDSLYLTTYNMATANTTLFFKTGTVIDVKAYTTSGTGMTIDSANTKIIFKKL